MNESIRRLIEAFTASAVPSARALHNAVSTYGFLPLYVGWSRVLGITPGGEIVEWDPEGAREGIQAASNPYLRRVALAQGAIKYPELAPLLPTRPSEALTCKQCGGSGALADTRLVCECGGLGWLLPDEDRSESW